LHIENLVGDGGGFDGGADVVDADDVRAVEDGYGVRGEGDVEASILRSPRPKIRTWGTQRVLPMCGRGRRILRRM